MMPNNLEAMFSELIEFRKQLENILQDDLDRGVSSSIFSFEQVDNLLRDLRSEYKKNKKWFEGRVKLIQEVKKQLHQLNFFVQLSQLVELGEKAEVAMKEVEENTQDIDFDQVAGLNGVYQWKHKVLLEDLRRQFKDFPERFSDERIELIKNAKEQIRPWEEWLLWNDPVAVKTRKATALNAELKRENAKVRTELRQKQVELQQKKNKHDIRDWDFD